mmetsp:Transcript_42011/g.121811  ORF Transcript_42011/g.121811 Transcript_42011/m.121811 type:complete len:433 (-) Transcript_42011:226-1524(-)
MGVLEPPRVTNAQAWLKLEDAAKRTFCFSLDMQATNEVDIYLVIAGVSRRMQKFVYGHRLEVTVPKGQGKVEYTFRCVSPTGETWRAAGPACGLDLSMRKLGQPILLNAPLWQRDTTEVISTEVLCHTCQPAAFDDFREPMVRLVQDEVARRMTNLKGDVLEEFVELAFENFREPVARLVQDEVASRIDAWDFVLDKYLEHVKQGLGAEAGGMKTEVHSNRDKAVLGLEAPLEQGDQVTDSVAKLTERLSLTEQRIRCMEQELLGIRAIASETSSKVERLRGDLAPRMARLEERLPAFEESIAHWEALFDNEVENVKMYARRSFEFAQERVDNFSSDFTSRLACMDERLAASTHRELGLAGGRAALDTKEALGLTAAWAETVSRLTGDFAYVIRSLDTKEAQGGAAEQLARTSAGAAELTALGRSLASSTSP